MGGGNSKEVIEKKRLEVFAAAYRNDAERVEYLICYSSAGFDPDMTDDKNRTPLYIATLAGNAETVRKLVKAGANCETMYHFDLESGGMSSEPHLYPSIDHMEDSDTFKYREANQLAAYERSYMDKVSHMAYKGHSTTVLHIAVAMDYVDVVRELLCQKRPIVDQITKSRNTHGNTPLGIAIELHHAKCEELLHKAELGEPIKRPTNTEQGASQPETTERPKPTAPSGTPTGTPDTQPDSERYVSFDEVDSPSKAAKAAEAASAEPSTDQQPTQSEIQRAVALEVARELAKLKSREPVPSTSSESSKNESDSDQSGEELYVNGPLAQAGNQRDNIPEAITPEEDLIEIKEDDEHPELETIHEAPHEDEQPAHSGNQPDNAGNNIPIDLNVIVSSEVERAIANHYAEVAQERREKKEHT